jgi:hypothetical protein
MMGMSVLLRFAVIPEHGLAGCNGSLASHGRIRYILRIRCSYNARVCWVCNARVREV